VLERREVRRAFDQHIERVARPWRRIPRGPQETVVWWCALSGSPELAQPMGVMSVDHTLDRVSGNAIGDSKNIRWHRAQTVRR
jgi:hypothetical protein